MKKLSIALLVILFTMTSCATTPEPIIKLYKEELKTIAVISAMGNFHGINIVPRAVILLGRETFEESSEVMQIDHNIEKMASLYLANEGYKVIFKPEERHFWNDHAIEEVLKTDYFDKYREEGIDAVLVYQPAESLFFGYPNPERTKGYGVNYGRQRLFGTKPKYIYLIYRCSLVSTSSKELIVSTLENHYTKVKLGMWPGQYERFSNEDQQKIRQALEYLVKMAIPSVLMDQGL